MAARAGDRGSARFPLAGESFDAPVGTYFRVTDPAIHRHAVALPSAWE